MTFIGTHPAIRKSVLPRDCVDSISTSCTEDENFMRDVGPPVVLHWVKDLAFQLLLRQTENMATEQIATSSWQPWVKRDAEIRRLDTLLASTTQKDAEIALRVERAELLAEMGRSLDARNDHLKVLELDPTNRASLFGLGRLLVSTGQLKAAEMVYSEAVRLYPGDVALRVNLGSVLLQMEHPLAARSHYETALELDPDFPQAHGGMYYALTQLGEWQAAKLHQEKAFGQKNLFPSSYHGDSTPIPVLLLVSSTGGNTPIEKLLDPRVFQTYVVVADFYDTKIPLPAHRLVINGIGDCDVSEKALLAAEGLLAFTSAPVLNAPAAVRATGRCENAGRLGKLQGIKTPAMVTYPYQVLAGPHGPYALTECGLTFPVLLRTPGFHMGRHFVRVETPLELADQIATLPQADVLAMEYLDARGADGMARKYRVMIVGGKLYPLHLAISRNWKIHYFSADMRDRADHRAEEESFLADMSAVLGLAGMAALEKLTETLGLDYGGIDFGLNQQGEILLFEANATMVVEQPDPDPRWDYRRAAVERIHQAVRALLMTTAGAVTASPPSQ
jgi:tetratricopeptide (TPR) repeat protein